MRRKTQKHAYVKTKCYVAIVKFQLKVVRHLVITVTQSVGDETYKFIRTRIKHHCL